MAGRKSWTFPLISKDVAEAARSQAVYHEGRATWWTEERDKADKAFSNSAKVEHQEVTGGKRAQLVADPVAAQRLSECESRLSHHQDQAKTYREWVAVLELQPELTVYLDVDDYTYFFRDKEAAITVDPYREDGVG